MKVKTFLKPMIDVEVVITTKSGWQLAKFWLNNSDDLLYVNEQYLNNEIHKVKIICDTVFISVKA